MLCFNQLFPQYLFAFGISGQGGSGFLPEAIKETAEDKHNNDDEVDKQHSHPETQYNLFLWIGLSVRLTEATMVISVWVLWVPTPDPVSQLERHKWRVVVAADALFSTVPSRWCPARDGTICLLN